MNPSLVACISSLSLFARARMSAGAKLFFMAMVATVSSTGLISGKDSNQALERWKSNRELALKNASEIEKTLLGSLQNDLSPVVRQGAAQQLGNYSQNPLVVRGLADALENDTDKAVRYASALSLGLSPTFKALRALEKASVDPDPALRRQIAFSLKRHRIGANRIKAQQLLKKLLADSDVSVREMALDSK